MKKKVGFKPLLTLITVMVMFFAMSITVLADYGSAQEAINDFDQLPSNVRSLLSDKADSNHPNPVTVNGEQMYCDEDAVIAAANKASTSNASALADSAAIEDFSAVTAGFGLQADVATAGAALSGFTGAIRVLMGVIVILISVGMTVFSGFDLCYIAFPVFRNKCEDAKQSGGGMMVSNKKGANGEAKLRFVSDDAQYAVVAADTTQSGKNPFIIYFSKHLLSYIVLAILLFIFLTGRVTVFTDIALRLVSGILNMLQGI